MNIHEFAIHQEALGCYLFHNISKHISISVFQNMFCVFFAGFLKIIAPGGGVLARFFCPMGQGFALSLCPRGGEFALSKDFPGGLPGGMVRLGID